jgi:hypothetical protein
MKPSGRMTIAAGATAPQTGKRVVRCLLALIYRAPLSGKQAGTVGSPGPRGLHVTRSRLVRGRRRSSRRCAATSLRVRSRRTMNERQEKRQNSVSVSLNRSGSKQTSEQPKRKLTLSARERRLSVTRLRPLQLWACRVCAPAPALIVDIRQRVKRPLSPQERLASSLSAVDGSPGQ